MLQSVSKKAGTSPLKIIHATYGLAAGPPSLDVTTPVRFFVKDGEVRLPAGDKTAVLGFCRVEERRGRFKEGRRR